MPTLSFLSAVFYRFFIIFLGAVIAFAGVERFRSSRARTGEIVGSGKGFALSVKNVGLPMLFTVVGLVAIIFGMCNPPKVSYVETVSPSGDIRKEWRIEHLPGRNEQPKDVAIAELIDNFDAYEGERVRVKGLIVELLLVRPGGKSQYRLRLTLADGEKKVGVFTSKNQDFDVGGERVKVTGIVVKDHGSPLIVASPDKGGNIERDNEPE